MFPITHKIVTGYKEKESQQHKTKLLITFANVFDINSMTLLYILSFSDFDNDFHWHFSLFFLNFSPFSSKQMKSKNFCFTYCVFPETFLGNIVNQTLQKADLEDMWRSQGITDGSKYWLEIEIHNSNWFPMSLVLPLLLNLSLKLMSCWMTQLHNDGFCCFT